MAIPWVATIAEERILRCARHLVRQRVDDVARDHSRDVIIATAPVLDELTKDIHCALARVRCRVAATKSPVLSSNLAGKARSRAVFAADGIEVLATPLPLTPVQDDVVLLPDQ
jgi:hypothetical protein